MFSCSNVQKPPLGQIKATFLEGFFYYRPLKAFFRLIRQLSIVIDVNNTAITW